MPDEAPRRRLPVLQSRDQPPPPAPDEERPPWHWSPIGALATFLVWLPLAALADKLAPWLTSSPEAPVQAPGVAPFLVQTLAFVASSFTGGFLVGRLGGKAGRKEATLSGVLAGALAWLLTITQGAPGSALLWLSYALLLVIIATLGGGSALLGGRLGLRLRPRIPPPAA